MSDLPHLGLSDRVCLVTGGAQGIGEACARRFAREGAQVVVLDVADEAGQVLAQSLGATYIHADVGCKTQVHAAMAQIQQRHGRLDVLVNNAGIFKAAPFLEMTEADFDAVLRVNLKGAFLVGQAAAKLMSRNALLAPTDEDQPVRGRGAIVNMSSVNGTLAIAELTSYNVSKGGINQLTRAMALGLADWGIRVNAVAPGTIATELAAQAVLGNAAARQRVLGRTPLKRLGTPTEVAEVVAFLAADASAYMTGEVVVVDGGRMALNYTVATD